jgi:hypothetical protein
LRPGASNPIALAALAGLLIGLGNSEVRRFEREAASEIRSKLQGGGADVTVQARLNGVLGGPLGDLKQVVLRGSNFAASGLPLFTEPERSRKGIVRELKIELEEFDLAGLRVAHLEAASPDCRFDLALALRRRTFRLSRSGLGRGTVRVREKDLADYLMRKYPELQRLSVRIEKGHAFVEGFGQFLILQTDFWLVARLEPRHGVELVLTNARVVFGDRVADEASKRALLDALNPVVHLDKDLRLHGALTLEGVRLEHGVLEAWGATRIPTRPAAESEAREAVPGVS